ncbi:SseB family protein [uncultured Methanobrevibacter sp.]|uniref:SseB family protein n=1 Tax=uncultured Methanobrevibacter sp. TaxID=253161 RepID=UPI002622B98F|nr:SseB family protein [uncultured Methanobrevibacter sp.]
MNLDEKLIECEELYKCDDYRGLIEKCDEILEEFPDNQNAVGYKGISLCFLDEYDEAINVLSEGIERYPDNYYLKNNLAMVYYDLGDYEKSLKLCEEGLKIKEFDWLCENKFKNLIKLGRIEEAIDFEDGLSEGINLPLVFIEEDMVEHELDYFSHLLKRNPDDYYVIEMIKHIAAHRYADMTPEVGDYYLKWIGCIKSSDGELSFECGNSNLGEYARFKVFSFESVMKRLPGKCHKLDEVKNELVAFDDEELDAFINRLIELEYIVQTEEGCIELAGGNDVVDTVVDNSRLEELTKQQITPQMESEVFALLKEARLFLPVDFGPDTFKEIENSKPGDKIEGPEGFTIQALTDHDGRKAVPLFTSEKMMKEAGALTSVMVIYMGDLAGMLKQTDKYSVIAMNPFTRYNLNMPIGAFLALFD